MATFKRALIVFLTIVVIFVLCNFAEKGFSDPSLEVMASDRTHPFGTLYHSGAQQFYETWPIKGEVPENCVRKFPMMELTYKSTVVTSKRDLMEAYGLDSNMQLAVLSGAVNAAASLSFMGLDESTSSMVVAVTMATVPTHEQKLDLNCDDLDSQFVLPILNETKANYFVSSIIFGFRYKIIFKAETTTTSSSTELTASLTAYLNKMTAAFEINMSGGASDVEERTDVNVTYIVKGHVDLPEKEIAKYSDLVAYVKQVNKNLKEEKKQNNTGTALYYVLTPINDLFKRANLSRVTEKVFEVSDEFAKKALFVMEDAERVHKQAKDLGTELRRYSSCIPIDQYRQLTRAVLAHQLAYDDFRKNISVAITKERSGESGKIDAVLKLYEDNDYSPAKFESLLKSDYTAHMNSLQTLKNFMNIHVNCLPVDIGPIDVPLLFHNATFILLEYWTNKIGYHLDKWVKVTEQMKYLCMPIILNYTRNVQCYQTDCQFNQKLCTGGMEPKIRMAHEGKFINLTYVLS